MNTDIAKFALEFLKLLPRYLVAIAVICGFLLFSAQAVLQAVGLNQFAEDYRQWLGIAFVTASVLVSIDGGKEIARVVRNRMRVSKFRKSCLQRLHALTEDEKQILRFCVAQQTRTNMLSLADGVAQGLVAAGIITRGSFGNPHSFAHNLEEWAWEYLNEHSELLNGTTRFCRTDARPDRPY